MVESVTSKVHLILGSKPSLKYINPLKKKSIYLLIWNAAYALDEQVSFRETQ